MLLGCGERARLAPAPDGGAVADAAAALAPPCPPAPPSPSPVRGTPGRWAPLGPWLAHARSIHASPDGRLYAVEAGLLHSDDGGETWSWGRGDVTDLVVAPDAALYALTPSGLERSDDGGASWRPRLAGRCVSRLVVTRAALLAVTCDDGLLRSTDGGASFTGIALPPGDWVQVAADPVLADVFYVQRGAGLFRTEDGGASFVQVAGEPADVVGRALAHHPTVSGTLYRSRWDPACLLRHSEDRGTTWRCVGQGLPGDPEQLWIDRHVPGRVFAASRSWPLHRSLDAGATFVALEGHADSLAVSARDPDQLYTQGYDGFRRSSDGGATWREASLRGAGEPLHLVADAPGGALLVTGRFGGIWRSADGGATWSLALRRGGRVAALARAGEVVYAADDDGVQRLDPGAPEFAATTLTGLEAWSLALDADGLHAGTVGSVLRTANGGRTWVSLPDSPRRARAVVAASGALFAGSEGGLFTSRDRGATWARGAEGLPPGPVTHLVADRSTLVAASPRGPYRSSDGGRCFAPAGLEERPVEWLGAAEGSLLAVSRGLLLESRDGGLTWSRHDAVDVRSAHRAGGRLFAATGRGLVVRSEP